jgi:uncharacterized membrane protein
MRSPDDIRGNRPPALRVASFAATSIGGLLVGLGSLMSWAVIEIPGTTSSAPPTPVVGVDTPEGKVTLLLGLVLLIGGVAMRAITSRGFARVLGWIVMVSGLLATAIGVLDVVRKDSAFNEGAEKLARSISAPSGLPVSDLIDRIRRIEVVNLKLGIYIVIAGGVVGLIGGLLGLAWGARRDRAPNVADEPLPGDRSTPLPPPEPGPREPPAPGSQLPPDESVPE